MPTPKLIETILEAASAQDIESGSSGPWQIKKLPVVGPEPLVIDDIRVLGRPIHLPPGVYTSLFKFTDKTIHLSVGELVMHDFPEELRKHLHFMLKAHGRVLITGLGLGCVARGCAANPNVDTVTVIEKDPDVLKLVAPYMGLTGNLPAIHGGSKISVIQGDALEWCRGNEEAFDCAWHDLWTDESKGEPHLQVLHQRLMIAMAPNVRDIQGAWAIPRWFKRMANVI